MQELKLEIGKTYVNRRGDEVRIVGSCNDCIGFYYDNLAAYYYENGESMSMSEEYDLIKEAEDVPKLKSKTKLYRSGSSTLAVTSGDNVVTLRDSIGSLGYTTDENEVEAILTDTQNGYICKFPSFNSVSQDYYVCLDYAQAEYLYLVLKETVGKNIKRVKE